ncbi:hypothetical protein PSN45_004923 [Yamadazyma tenuis]|uniref:WD40 repeat-like protein n=1 Tax=Candida tenuis (strain ATCC 10573 / BCRC 21748 / CBS 615 / JCM 9827 / NBRC 10315 / NRRL Y-1498 / VKM Y-70) TaxID=590646 RepID=G3B250_CANTC|nr:WD40 repeat-like protein [Yamadazyma tenuis ATCC 10573]XP_006685854.1 uncharacterized protein CANTEDRAFT_113375 [Yamadazyma tenuis ATCC 10573]EGV65047.1 WD40 repeat-like protein [Yamadazyma tenuis ATCC 10573]EGV65048.1 hypothetical protein CANTEDRAFT_113375 [Yamadazyma tenuis ATCC 10573]WEJ97372.1 hypothetical protein PSN45_004923 [Yamadazyma tenuis]
MQSLINDRKVGQISPGEFCRTLTESGYSALAQNCFQNVFPINCHNNAAVNSLSLETQDFQFLLSGCADSSIKLWDLHFQEQLSSQNDVDDELPDYDNPVRVFKNIATVPRKSYHDFGVSCIQWWPVDTGMFVSGSFDHTIKVWDTNELSVAYEFNLNNRVYSFDTNYENTLIATASDQPFIRLLDLRSASSAHTLTGHKEKTLCVKWHPRNPNLLASGGFDGEVKVWDIRRSTACLCRLDMLRTSSSVQAKGNLSRDSVKAHSAPVNGLVWDPLGTTLFSAGNDDRIRVWDMLSFTYPPVNKLTSFGPLMRNKYLQTIPITLNYRYESELQHLIFPSDNSDIFVFRTIDGKLVKRLNRKGSKNIGRTCSIAMGAPFSNRFYCGTIDGEILAFSPILNTVKKSDIIDQTYVLHQAQIHGASLSVGSDDELIKKARLAVKSGNSLDIDKL